MLIEEISAAQEIKAMNKKQLLEFIPLVVFLLSGIGILFKAPYCTWIATGSASLLAIVYSNGSNWLFAGFGISKMQTKIAGYAFAANMVGCMFCLLRWPGAQFYCIASYVGLALVAGISLYNYRVSAYKQLLYRSFLFIVILSMIFGYRSS